MKKVIVLLIVTLVIISTVFSVEGKSRISLNKKSATIYVGQIIKLKVKKTRKKVKWKSSNKKVVMIDAKGKVIGIKVGKSTITAKVGKKKLKCKIIVKKKPIISQYNSKKSNINNKKNNSSVVIGNPSDWDFDYTESGSIVIRAYKGNQTTITIPNYINGNEVTSIKGHYTKHYVDGFFRGYENTSFPNAKEIIISDSVVVINKCSFAGCSKLERISLPSKLKNIEESLFSYCTVLSNVSIPNSVTSIAKGAFIRCDKLYDITIPSTVTYIAGNSIKEGEYANWGAENGVFSTNKKTTIHGKKGSYAERFVNYYGYPLVFQPI